MTVLTDQYPNETTWTIVDESGSTVWTGGPYSDQFTTYSETTCLPYGCYTLTVNDSYGDGICCAFGEGSYTLTSGGSVLTSGGEFGAVVSSGILFGLTVCPGLHRSHGGQLQPFGHRRRRLLH